MPRNKVSNQRVKDERREKILAAALILFSSKGLSATKISDISLKSGMSQGLIYHYYRSKEEIFIWLIRFAIERINEAALRLEQMPLSAKAKIILAIKELIKGFDKSDDTARYYYLITQAALSSSIPAEAKETIRRENDKKYEVVERIFLKGQEEGTIKNYNAHELTTLFWSSINGLALNKAMLGENFKMPDTNILLSMFLEKI